MITKKNGTLHENHWALLAMLIGVEALITMSARGLNKNKNQRLTLYFNLRFFTMYQL